MRPALACLALILALGASPARAQSADGPRPHVVLGFDDFRGANSTDGLKQAVENGARGVVPSGSSVSGGVDTGDALGGRIAFFAPVSDTTSVGPSFGYLRGPNASANLSVHNLSGDGTLSADRSLYWLRLLTEVEMRFPLRRGPAAILLGGGVGVARGRVRESLSCSGGSACSAATSAAASWFGLTWEFSPGFAYKNLSAGYRWAGFPAYTGSSQISRIDWRTSEIYFALTF